MGLFQVISMSSPKTAKVLREELNSIPDDNFEYDKKYYSIECPICSTCRMITEGLINSLYPI